MSETFNVDDFIAEADYAPFPFTYKGEQHELPHTGTLTMREQITLAEAQGSNLGDSMNAIREIAPEAIDVILDMPAGAGLALIAAWNKHSGMEPGESSGSDDSSKSTAGPSKPTSGGTTANRSARRSQGTRAR